MMVLWILFKTVTGADFEEYPDCLNLYHIRRDTPHKDQMLEDHLAWCGHEVTAAGNQATGL